MKKQWKLPRDPSVQVEHSSRHRRRIQGWAGDEQGATNDSKDYAPKLTFVDGYPIIYSCEEKVEARGSEVSLLVVHFDYEVTVRTHKLKTLSDNLRGIQWSLLWNVAKSIGLDECELQALEGQGSLMMSREQNRGIQEQEPSYIVMLGSRPKDSIDIDTAVCKFTSFDTPSEFCVPISGTMTAMHTGNATDAVKKFLLAHVEVAMKESSIVVDDVTHVVYVGDRGAVMPRNRVATPASEGSDKTPAFFISVPTAVVFLLAILFGVIIVRRFRKSEKVVDTMETTPADVESNPTWTGKATKDSATASLEYRSKKPSVGLDVPNKSPLLAPPTSSTQHLAKNPVRPDVPLKPPICAPSSPEGESALPEPYPLPAPVVAVLKRQASLPARRKRRKKKKKQRKKCKLKLSPVKGMETIVEGEEEEGDEYDSSDCGSEYSADEELGLKRSLSCSDILKTFPENKSDIPRLPPPWV